MSDRARLGWRDATSADDARAHRIAHEVDAVKFKVVDKPRDVTRHQIGRIGLGIVEFGARAVTAVVEPDHPPPGLGQRVDPARIDPIDAAARAESMHEHDRLAAIRADGGVVVIGDADAVGKESVHGPEWDGGERSDLAEGLAVAKL